MPQNLSNKVISSLLNTAKLFTAFEHQTYPFDELVKDLNISRDTSRNPLFDTMFTYQNNGNPKVNLNGINTKYYIPDNHSSKFDFSLEILPDGSDLKLNLEYCTKLFSKNFMDKFLQHYINILNVLSDASTYLVLQSKCPHCSFNQGGVSAPD